MKKTYISFLSLLSTLPLSSMEQQQQKPLQKGSSLVPTNSYVQRQRQPLFTPSVWGDVMPVYYTQTNYPQQQNVVCTANETGWQKLNQIAFDPYTSNNHIEELQPIYSRTPKAVKAEEKKTLLPKAAITKTSPLKSDATIMKELFNKAFYALCDENHLFKSQLCYNRELKELIHDLKKAKKQCINEDCMATYSYKGFLVEPKYYYVATLFYCLKKYNKAVLDNQEKIPSKNISITATISSDDDFLKKLGLEELSSTLKTENPLATNQKFQTEHPAYNNLIISLQKLVEYQNNNMYEFIHFLDSAKPLDQENENSYDTLKKTFYDKAYYILRTKKRPDAYDSINDWYDLLETIHHIKKNSINREMDLGKDIFIGKEETFLEKCINSFKSTNYTSIYTKNLISILCKLIEEYNTRRGNKKTPSDQQIFNYNIYKKVDIELPDSFNKNLFDPNIYAIKELSQLIDDTTKLLSYSVENIEIMAQRMYPQQGTNK